MIFSQNTAEVKLDFRPTQEFVLVGASAVLYHNTHKLNIENM